MLRSATDAVTTAGAERAAHPASSVPATAMPAALADCLRMRVIPSGDHRVLPASGDERARVGQGDRPFPGGVVGHVARLPVGIELLLVGADALKVVPLLAAAKDQGRQPLAPMSAAMFAHRGQR